MNYRHSLRYLFFSLLIFSGIFLFAEISVDYTDNTPRETIATFKLDNIDYFNLSELNKVFQAKINADYIDQRVIVQMYNETLIILLDSQYLLWNNDTYNFQHPLLLKDNKFIAPLTLITKVLSGIFKDKLTFSQNKIIASPPFDNSIKTIIIDPGHGGKDPGAIGISGNIYEKDITLKIAKLVQKYLKEKLPKVKVVLTRDSDKFVSLHDRTSMANNLKADVFVSIHCNANRNSKSNGTEVYYLSTSKTNEARAVEALENSVVEKYEGGLQAVKKYDDLSFILADMSQNEHLQESYHLSDILQQEIVKATNFKNRGVKQANFYVMRGAFMPAVLVETGFLTNPKEEKLLNSKEYQEKIAKAIAESIIYFKKKHDSE